MYIDPRKINLQDAAGMQLVELIRDLADEIGSLPYDETPAMAGTGSAGESIEYARGDHQHPSDTSKLDVSDGERIENEALNAYPVNESQGGVVSFNDGSGLKANEVIVGIVPVQSGSGDPAPDNVRPISGWTGTKVVRTGKNLLDLSTLRSGRFDETTPFPATNVCTDGYSAVKGGSTICLDQDDNSNFAGRYIRFYDANHTYINSVDSYTHGAVTFSVPENACYFRIMWYNTDAYTALGDITSVHPRIAYGSSPAYYEAYAGTIIPISWEDEAGTVYGGTLDATTGVLTVDRAMLDMGAQELVWSKTTNFDSSHWRFYTDSIKTVLAVPESNSIKTSADCSQYSADAANDAYLNSPNGVFTVDTSGNVSVYDERYNDVSDFKTAMSGVQFVYPLATPQVYQLSATEVELLVGYNALWCDTGDVSVEYKADTTAFVSNAVNSLANILEKIITANIETEMKATKNYTANDLIIANGNLYKASSNIASGATLAVGTNVTATTIAAELASISVGG